MCETRDIYPSWILASALSLVLLNWALEHVQNSEMGRERVLGKPSLNTEVLAIDVWPRSMHSMVPPPYPYRYVFLGVLLVLLCI